MRPLLVIFAKAPRPGFVKTRLGLEPAAAASLHSEFVRRTLQTAMLFREEAALELSLDMECADWMEFSIPRTIQAEGDLGARLYRTLERGLSAGHPRVVVLGSDSPTLPPDHIRFLLEAEADVALGPAVDGGFYGIACRTLAPAMFESVRWSTSHALRDTVAAIERCGLSYATGPEWFDVDTPDDLVRLTGASFPGDRPVARTRAIGREHMV